MTVTNHCAENALAERMNGILKQEYGLGQEMTTKAAARQAVPQGIWLYNHKRPAHGPQLSSASGGAINCGATK